VPDQAGIREERRQPVSIGATVARIGATTGTLVEREDKLMIESKRRGRNLVSIEQQKG
jgi:hypothetical protein